MEVCVDSLESAINAVEGGANRLELCSSLAVGGLTPSLGILHCVRRKLPNIVTHVLIRCRDGDFLYTEDEIEVMCEDIKCLVEAGADGIVIGCLDEYGNVDVQQCCKLIETANSCAKGRQINVTFHRAFDMTPPDNLTKTMNDIIKIGCSRILTSGQQKTSIEGKSLIKELIENYGDQIIIMPGGGINENNLNLLLNMWSNDDTNDISSTKEKYQIKEFHASARMSKESRMKYRNDASKMGSNSDEYITKVTSSEIVQKMNRFNQGPLESHKMYRYFKIFFIWFYFQMIGVWKILQEQIWDRHRSVNVSSSSNKKGKTVVITGGNRGIGFEAVRKLLALEYHIIIGCRRPSEALDLIQHSVNKSSSSSDKMHVKMGTFECLQLNVASLKSVKQFASELIKRGTSIDILINNAGVMFGPYELTEDGLENQMGTNYFGHFLLTNLLLPVLKTSAESSETNSRIINVSSCAHFAGSWFDLDDLNAKEYYSAYQTYSNSKAAQIMFTKYLSQKLQTEECIELL